MGTLREDNLTRQELALSSHSNFHLMRRRGCS